MSNLINKAKAAVSSNKSNDTHVNNPHSTNTGPHISDMMNKMDPRVDSGRDNRNDPLSHAGGKGHVQQAPVGGHGTTTTTGAAGTTTRTGGLGHGAHGTHTVAGTHGTNGGAVAHIPGTGTPATHHATPGSGNAPNAGPHNSAMMNTLDPRVDSDMTGGKTYGGNATHR